MSEGKAIKQHKEADSAAPASADSQAHGYSRLRRLSRILTALLLTVLVLIAVYVTAGRLLMPVLTSQKSVIESRLETLFGVPVQIGDIEGTWFRFSPGFRLHDLSLQFDGDNPDSELYLAGAELVLDIHETLLGGQPALSMVELSGLRLVLQQLANGEWTLPGLPPGGIRSRKLFLDLLLETPRITIAESDVSLLFNEGQVLRMHALHLDVSNDGVGQHHQASLQFRPTIEVEPVHVRLSLDGDPRGRFAGNAWIELTDYPLHLSLQEFSSADWQVNSATTSASLWSSFSDGGLASLAGELHSLNVMATQQQNEQEPRVLNVNNAALQFSALRRELHSETSAAAWQVDVRDLAIDVQNSPLDLSSLQLYIPLEASDSWRLQVARVDVAPLSQALLGLPLPAAVQDALLTLDANGVLENLVLESDRTGEFPGGFALQANFRELAVEAWKGTPAGSGLAGYLQVDANGGMAEVDATDVRLHLPDLFRESWLYSSLNARVSWELAAGGFRIASSPIHVDSDRLRGVVQFNLDTTLPGWQSGFPELTLLVGMEHMDVALHSAYLPRLTRIANTMDWLDTALLNGTISNSMFILRTPTGGDPGPSSSTHGSWFEVDQARLWFLEGWPEVAIDSAWVKVQDQSVQVGSSAATIAGIDAHIVDAHIEPQIAGGSLLDLQVEATTSTDLGIRFLRESPLRDVVGDVLDDWQASGTLDLSVALAIPLGASVAQQRTEVAVLSEGSSLFLQDQSLTISDISGAVNYDDTQRLRASSLAARLFDADVDIDISTRRAENDEGDTITVTSTGRASVAALRDWEGQPPFVRRLLTHADGEMTYTATLDLPAANQGDRSPRLSLRSELLAVESRFPPPFAKQRGSVAELQLDMQFVAQGQNLQLRYGDWLSGELELDNEGINRGYLYVGPLNQNFTIRQTDALAEGLLVSGRLERFDFDAWQALGSTLMEGESSGKGLSDYLRLIDVDVQELLVRGQAFGDINVQVQFGDDAWQIQGRNALLAGTLQVPGDSSRTWQVDLEYLRLPARDVPEAGVEPEEVDILASIDPTALPALEFRTDELAIGEHQLGSWSFRLNPDAQGATIRDFTMQEATSSITGLPPQETDAVAPAGANIDWRYEDGQHLSRFEGVFSAGDLARVMPLWGHDANVVSTRADFRGSLQWPGSPLAFSLRKASGNMNMFIESGRFVDIDSGSSRLLGAFNFDALVRRLQLDFSDLYQRGFAFDDISGELDFIDGVVHTRSPLVIDGPSSRLAITGEVDLARETIMADMQVRIPLSENISLLAGLLGAWPIAVSTYIASKIFASQVEDFTTIIYRLEGPWSDPQAGFEAPEEDAVP